MDPVDGVVGVRNGFFGTKEWADYNINCINGCYNDCKYCYATMMAKRFGRATKDTWKDMKIRDDVVNRKFRKYPGRVMFPSSHDLFDIPVFEDACITVLEKLLESGNQVLVTTKPRYNIIKKIDELFNMYKDSLQFRFTITSMNNKQLKFWEPNAPLFEERMDSLQFAFNNGYKTSVSIEPFLDKDPVPLVNIVSPYVTESIWIGLMNYIPRSNIPQEEIRQYSDIRENYIKENINLIYANLKELKMIRWKDSFRKKFQGR